jgi:hypothetical protein
VEQSIKEVAEKAKYMLPRNQNAGHNREIKMAKRSSENVEQLKYLGTAVENKKFDSGIN